MKRPIVMLDSGAFSAWTQGVKIELDEYAEFVSRYGHLFETGIFNLDVIGDAKTSYANWNWLRRKGINTIPVFHCGSNQKWLRRYISKTNFVAIGGIAKLGTKKRTYWLDTIWKNCLLGSKGRPVCNVHGLGLTPTQGDLLSYPWFSVDSSTWTRAAGYGFIYLPTLTSMGPDYSRLNLINISSQNRRFHDSFFSLPRSVRDRYKQFFESLGHRIRNDLEGRKLNPRKTTLKEKKIPKWINLDVKKHIFSSSEWLEDDKYSGDLSCDWEARNLYNLEVTLQFARSCITNGRPIKFFLVMPGNSCSIYNERILNVFERLNLPPMTLASYFYLKKSPTYRDRLLKFLSRFYEGKVDGI